jgi:hypothetical protein
MQVCIFKWLKLIKHLTLFLIRKESEYLSIDEYSNILAVVNRHHLHEAPDIEENMKYKITKSELKYWPHLSCITWNVDTSFGIFQLQWTCAVAIMRGCIQKFTDWLPGARTANGTALCH